MSLDAVVDKWARLNGNGECCRESYAGRANLSRTYVQLSIDSKVFARQIYVFTRLAQPFQPVAICARRGYAWFVAYIACVRLGVPVVPMSQDTGKKEAEYSRNSEILTNMEPVLLLHDSETGPEVIEIARARGIPCVALGEPFLGDSCDTEINYDSTNSQLRQNPLAYLYTGGTTSASKCVAVSHAMAAHEMRGYPAVFDKTPTISFEDRVIQHSSSYWGATYLGQLNISLAFGCSVVFCDSSITDLTEVIEKERVTVVGLVPSQLAAVSGNCLSLKVVFTWGESLPKKLSAQWVRRGVRVVELLVSTEYWISMYALDGEVEFRVLSEGVCVEVCTGQGGHTSGQLLIAGACVTPWGYCRSWRDLTNSPTDSSSVSPPFTLYNQKRYFQTSDTVGWASSGRLCFHGRSDQMIKIGGEWRDIGGIESSLREIDGVREAFVGRFADLTKKFEGPNVIAFVVLESWFSQKGTLSAVRGTVNENYIKIEFLAKLPRNSVTNKVDRALLRSIMEQKNRDLQLVAQTSVRRRQLSMMVRWTATGLLVWLMVYLVSGLLGSLFLFPLFTLFFLKYEPGVKSVGFGRYTLYPSWMYRRLVEQFPLSHVGLGFTLTVMIAQLGLVMVLAGSLAISAGYWVFRGNSVTSFLSWPITFWVTLPHHLGGQLQRFWSFEKVLKGAKIPLAVTPRFGDTPPSSGSRVTREWAANCATGSDLAIKRESGLSSFRHEKLTITEPEMDLICGLANESFFCRELVAPNEVTVSCGTTCSPQLQAIIESSCDTLPRPVTGGTSLSSLSSLAAVELANQIRRVANKNVSVAHVLSSGTVGDLSEKIDKLPLCDEHRSDGEKAARSVSSFSSYRCQLWGWHFPCMWVFEMASPPDYNILKSALSLLAQRHPALVAKPLDAVPVSYWHNETLVVMGMLRHWIGQSWVYRKIGQSVFETWNRVAVPPRPCIYLPWRIASFKSEKDMRSHLLWKKTRGQFYAPMELELMQLEDRYFLRMYVTHAFSDGSSVVPLVKDLNEIFGKLMMGGNKAPVGNNPSTYNGLAMQQDRLHHSLTSSEILPHDLYMCYSLDLSLEKDTKAFGKIIVLDPSLLAVAHAGCVRLGCSVDVLLLTAIVAALTRLWKWKDVARMALVVPLRDNPHETEVVGFLADQRNMDVPLGHADYTTLFSLVHTINTIRKDRKWTIPEPFSNCERSLVNIVPGSFSSYGTYFKQELFMQQNEIVEGQLYRPLELYLEQLDAETWSLRARCRLLEYDEQKLQLLMDLFKSAIVDMLVNPNQLLHE